MKPFNLEEAKAGKPICTRDGRKARIICFDAKGDYPIVALIEMGTAETPNSYPIDGKAVSTKENSCDLMMLPEKKEGYINLYKGEGIFAACTSHVYKSEEDAKDSAHLLTEPTEYIKTIKVEWEE